MKKFWTASLLLLATLALAACGKLSFNDTSTTSSGTKTESYQTTGTVNDALYQGVIKNGRYQISSARGLTIQQNTQGGNNFNVKSMETGLTNLAQKQFSTSKYVFQEGQLITTATAKSWLARKTDKNADGLNPEDNGQEDADKRAPMYLQSLVEQDFMTQDGSNLKLGGIAIALALNEYDYYQKVKYGATYTTTIDQTKLAEEGKQIAAKVVARLRKMDGVSADIPIIVGLYRNAARDSLVGGVFFAEATAASGDSLGSWTNIDQQNEVLPVIDNKKPINSTVATDFNSFTTQIENFFPTLAGVTAQTHYENGALTGMNITINTQFYGETEIESFTQYVGTTASKYLPSGAKIEITVQATQGIQAFLARESGAKDFTTHVFGSY
ncbi:CamS family sex pheromone protein [Lacticaseibacillus daqingensis]|uniref:CamS family sex pheromone protein n=1 Tax=Lacticaseibacillus daqingensis TaxID=2486014 RepID=UPI000F777636|nr:CamS family sex pheromone protein [Lacticaseibacillus daqingensis]